ncbi:MAG: hypothetical protein IJH64_00240 [Oscillospiraceae bacterium]|nr:hypothetical protein [Oscillospiraceae bacterium]
MDKFKAQQSFWSGFGLTAYDENTVPDDATYPYLTYQAVLGSLEGEMTVSANLWYRGHSWEEVSKKALEIEKSINQVKRIDGGYIKVRKPDANFAQRLREESDDLVRRILLTVNLEFLSE